MVQLNLLLDNRRAKSDGTYSIIFRIIQFKTVYTISSGISISKIHWDYKKRGHLDLFSQLAPKPGLEPGTL